MSSSQQVVSWSGSPYGRSLLLFFFFNLGFSTASRDQSQGPESGSHKVKMSVIISWNKVGSCLEKGFAKSPKSILRVSNNQCKHAKIRVM